MKYKSSIDFYFINTKVQKREGISNKANQGKLNRAFYVPFIHTK